MIPGSPVKLEAAGFTLLEMMMTTAIIGIVTAGVMAYLPKVQTYFQGLQMRQQMQSESRSAMEVMMVLLRNGKASPIPICPCGGAPAAALTCAACTPLTTTATDLPSSQIDFVTQDGHTRRFFWTPPAPPVAGMLTMGDITPGNPEVFNTLAHNVTNVTFTSDPRDFSIVTINLSMNAPLDRSGLASHMMTVSINPQSVRMVSSQ